MIMDTSNRTVLSREFIDTMFRTARLEYAGAQFIRPRWLQDLYDSGALSSTGPSGVGKSALLSGSIVHIQLDNPQYNYRVFDGKLSDDSECSCDRDTDCDICGFSPEYL